MVGIYGISQTYQPANPRRFEQQQVASPTATDATDGVAISPEAAGLAAFLPKADETQEVRADRVAEVTQSLQQGAYKLQQVLLQTAARVSTYLV